MMRDKRLEHRFVEHIPGELAPGVLYVSIKYATAVHSCCCGCGEEVVTPFTPTDWKMIFDGETISLTPSIGNWNQLCRSHYFIDRGRVAQAGTWTNEQVAAERHRDHETKAKFYGQMPVALPPAEIPLTEAQLPKAVSLWHRIWYWFTKPL
jgi:hypothetical protein